MKPIHLLIAAFIVIAFAFIAYRGGETPVKDSAERSAESPRVVQQPPQTE